MYVLASLNARSYGRRLSDETSSAAVNVVHFRTKIGMSKLVFAKCINFSRRRSFTNWLYYKDSTWIRDCHSSSNFFHLCKEKNTY